MVITRPRGVLQPSPSISAIRPSLRRCTQWPRISAHTSEVNCLEEFDPSVKEAAAWALGYIARHTKELAQCVVDAGAVPLLVLCFQEPELTLKRISALRAIRELANAAGTALKPCRTR